MALASWTDEQIFAQLNSGTKWSGSTITYAFATSTGGIYTGSGEGTGFTALASSQQTMADLALRLWDDLMVNSFQKVAAGTGYSAANLEFGNSTTGVSYAHAYFPGVGSVWFNNAYASGTNNLVSPTVGIHGFATYVHEIGHALGLEHMGDYNGSAGSGPSSYQDSTVYSIMSYYGPSWGSGSGAGEGQVAWADWVNASGRTVSPNTPMLNDIMAIQRIYGADYTTRAGDTVYGFSSTITDSTKAVYDFTVNLSPVLCIWDGAGEDTLNLSGWSTASVINLAPGSFSSGNSMTSNISIAYNCNIENAVGGAGNDTISGNTLANSLTGNGGSDTINGLAGNDRMAGGGGNDTINGGDGEDTVVLGDDWSGITWTYDAGTASFTFQGATLGTDVVTGVEYFIDAANVVKSVDELNGTATPKSVLSLSASQTSVEEGHSGTVTVTFTLTLDVASGTDQSVDWAIAGTGANAASASDFSGALSGSVTFAAGETEATVTISVAGDLSAEQDEAFRLALTNATSGLTIGSANPAVTILNDDGTPVTVMTGTSIADLINGSVGADQISALGGNDTVYGLGGDDTLIGGLGNDKLIGGDGNDTYVFDGGADTVTETATGGTDTVQASVSAVTLSNYVENLVYVGAGNFTGTGNSGANRIEGGNGSDILTGGLGNDTLLGNGGVDVLNGGAGLDAMDGGDGGDIYLIALAGEHGAAEIADTGTTGADELRFAAGSTSTLTLFAGDTGIERVVFGTGSGAVARTSGTAALSLNATALANGITVIGNSGANLIQATAQADRIEAGVGNDTLMGKDGNDTLLGGAGYDQFVFDTALSGGNVDTLGDFSVLYDTIRLENAVFTELTLTGVLSSASLAIGAAALDADDRILYDSATGALSYDADGNGADSAVQFASLATGLALTGADFIVI